MKVTVIGGSPKGKYSVTIQYVEYLKKHYPQDEFEIIYVGNKVKKYSDPHAISECIDRLALADLIIFNYPVYTFLAPYQLARFIYNLKRNPNAVKLKGKFVTQMTTSKHFFDTTAHRYIKENCDDLALKSITGLAADMDDLLSPEGRSQLKAFYDAGKFAVENDIYNRVDRVMPENLEYVYDGKSDILEKVDRFDTVIVTDCKDSDITLRNMIDTFINSYKYPLREVNIDKFKFSGGCLGCFDCATDGTCIYKDGFENMLRDDVQNADVIVLAGKITDHTMGPVFKCYDDRQFCNGHRVLTKGMSVGYILDGDLSIERNLQDVIESRSEIAHMYLAGIATSESKDNDKITVSLGNLAKTIAFAMENKLQRPQNFYGIGGMKIFRDLIYVMRGLMKEDHAFYKKHDIYNFPHKQRKLIWKMKFVGMLMSVPAIKKKSRSMMNDIMLKPYLKAMDKE